MTRLDSLTGIRAVAALLVFWHHSSSRFEGSLSSGMVGVSLFYLLSGFVMAWTDRPGESAWRYYRKRFARIYPAYLVACALVIGWRAVRSGFEFTDLAALTLLQSWVPDPAIYFAAQAIFWSLSCETFFYLAFPMIRLMTRRLKGAGLTLLGVAAGVVSTCVAVVGVGLPDDVAQWATGIFPLARIPEFVVGVVIGTLFSRGWRPRISLMWTVPLAAFAVAVAAFAPLALSRYAITLIPFVLLVVALAASDLEGRANIFGSRPMVTLGVWSYCIYLVHGLALWGTDAVAMRLHLPATVSVAAALVLTCVGAWLLHRVVEAPAERLLRPRGRALNSSCCRIASCTVLAPHWWPFPSTARCSCPRHRPRRRYRTRSGRGGCICSRRRWRRATSDGHSTRPSA
ncbi:acyltransferase [Microbacterium paludicola]|uniref:acyltransferase family protein n=1 Tax=Microbacterium paludicola TaxID=300019 RepID=UPI0031DA93C0